MVNAFYEAATAAGVTGNGEPGARLHYDPRYYAANVFDPDGYSLEVVYKSWQHSHCRSQSVPCPITLQAGIGSRRTSLCSTQEPVSDNYATNPAH